MNAEAKIHELNEQLQQKPIAPAYEADNGPLTNEQVAQIKRNKKSY